MKPRSHHKKTVSVQLFRALNTLTLKIRSTMNLWVEDAAWRWNQTILTSLSTLMITGSLPDLATVTLRLRKWRNANWKTSMTDGLFFSISFLLSFSYLPLSFFVRVERKRISCVVIVLSVKHSFVEHEFVLHESAKRNRRLHVGEIDRWQTTALALACRRFWVSVKQRPS